ncbi:uncharacterized protein si:ch73-109d9.1 isoform X2 [Clupea harengus]|uniref:Uncharacterized protein si:ch73-109d9.1 isoform X2 n=1 Tax=Clupea harengus TaxID=7950 RepID=A0A6P3W8T2_CLUHA|nr:uncharacterized protein si:ch73-109d9.1 isoform X2 [Clupea harengus]
MSEALILTFQSQLSSLMETVLKSAMYEVTRLVEDSFLEEVGRGKQEVEMLRLKLQLSELKLREKEREKVKGMRCGNCGRASATTDGTHDEPPAEADTLCLSLSVSEQRQCGQMLQEEEWISTETHDRKPHVTTAHVKDRGDSQNLSLASPSSTPDKQWTLQSPISTGSAINQEYDSLSGDKHKNRDTEPGGVLSSHTRESVQESQAALPSLLATLALPGSSRHSSTSNDFIPTSAFPDLKSESEGIPPVIKEEEEALPVWNPSREDAEFCQDMVNPSDTHSRGPWNREEMQVIQNVTRWANAQEARRRPKNRQKTFSTVARQILIQSQVWQKACYSRNIEWGPITAKIISAMPQLSGREMEVIVRCTKMLHNRRDYLRRRSKDLSMERSQLSANSGYGADVCQHLL